MMKREGQVASNRFKTLEPIAQLHETKIVTEDARYWKSYKFPITTKEYGAVTNIDIQPTFPHNLAVSSSARVQIYSGQTGERIKTFSRFHDTVYGASYRSDGKLLVVGSEDCHARLFDTEGRVPLRVFKGHTGPVHVSKFCGMNHIFTASDDKTVRVWDVATEKPICTLTDHTDYIRTGALGKSSSDIIASGSYDHTVKLYDKRTATAVMSVNHGQPVEAILVYPSGSILLSAGGNAIKVWDILQGGKLLTSVSFHHKAITCMTFNHDNSRLLSGSLDRHVKIYDVASYDVVHTIDYAGSILSMAVSDDDKILAVGMADKMLSIRQRKQIQTKEGNFGIQKSVTHKPRRYHYMPGKDYVANSDDITIHHTQKKRLPQYDNFFRKFEHSKALDAALSRRVPPEVTVAVMRELIRRNGLKLALAGRNSKELADLLRFTLRNVTKISFSPILLDVTDVLVDLYASQAQSLTEPARTLFIQLRDAVRNEAELHRQMYSIMGCMDALLSSNSQPERVPGRPPPENIYPSPAWSDLTAAMAKHRGEMAGSNKHFNKELTPATQGELKLHTGQGSV